MSKKAPAAGDVLGAAIAAAEQKQSRRRKKTGLTAAEQQELIPKARERFFDYCHLMAPDFYKPDRKFLVDLCDDLQEFYEDANSEQDIMVISVPPRHGKSRTAGLFSQWVFGKNPSEKIMTGSYNEVLSTTFSKNVRNPIQEIKLDPTKVVYSDVFPYTKIQQGDAAAHYWTIEGEYSSYLATSPTGTATGFGCGLMIIDDIIKNAYEAANENVLEGHWSWFTNTMMQRLETAGKIIIIMTRWASRDLAGCVINEYGDKVRKITKKAVQPDGNMLCDEILSKKAYDMKVKAMGADIAAANYQQEPLDLKGALYPSFKTYDTLPVNDAGKSLFTGVLAYIDTADEGDDYLCAIVYGLYNKEAYVLDVLYTKDAMEKTEPATAKMLYEHKVAQAVIESNNGGRGFARSVQRILKERFRSNKTSVRWFTQSRNKRARILSNATWVMEHIYFPRNWRDRWPDYHKAMTTYQKEGKNAHDDGPDATTGIAENCTHGSSGIVNVRNR